MHKEEVFRIVQVDDYGCDVCILDGDYDDFAAAAAAKKALGEGHYQIQKWVDAPGDGNSAS